MFSADEMSLTPENVPVIASDFDGCINP